MIFPPLKPRPSVTMSFPNIEPITFPAFSVIISEPGTETVAIESENAIHYHEVEKLNTVTIHIEDQPILNDWLVDHIGSQLQRQMQFFNEEDATKRLPYKFDMTADSVNLTGCFIASINYATPIHMDIEIRFDKRA